MSHSYFIGSCPLVVFGVENYARRISTLNPFYGYNGSLLRSDSSCMGPQRDQLTYYLLHALYLHRTGQRREWKLSVYTPRGNKGKWSLVPFILNFSTVCGWVVVSLTPRPSTPVPIEWEAGWDPETIWTISRRVKCLVRAGIWTLQRPARSLVTILTTLSSNDAIPKFSRNWLQLRHLKELLFIISTYNLEGSKQRILKYDQLFFQCQTLVCLKYFKHKVITQHTIDKINCLFYNIAACCGL
jgi:hypothetical protein